MEKKNLKWYETPQVEIVEMEMQGAVLLSASGLTDSTDDPEGRD